MRYGRCDGGPVEVCKAFMSGWQEIRQPDAVLPCATVYGDHTIEMLQQAQINWIWVTWSVGFSRESEAVQRRLVRPFIAKCKAAGIHVTAYFSLTNMFIDDMLERVPASKQWMQMEKDGTPRPYGAAKYDGKPTRIVACLNQRGWIDYSRKAIAEAVEAGVDAIFYDNCIQGCKCEACRRRFAEHTGSHYGHPLPVPGFKTADAAQNLQGREQVDAREFSELAERAWQRFCQQTMGSVLAGHRHRANSLKPGILVYANTHQQPHMNNHLNALFSEDGVEPGLKGKEISSNIALFKFYYAEGDGWRPIRIENGKRIHRDRMEGPMPPRNLSLAAYEAAACQGAMQTFFEMGWTTKLARGDRDAREALDALTAANRWLREHEGLFAEVEPIAKTAVVLPAAQPLAPLIRARKNFVVLQPKQLSRRQLDQFELVVLPNVRFLSDGQVRAILGYVEGGGNLIATGETAWYDADSLKRRAEPGLQRLYGRIDGDTRRIERRFGRGACVYLPLPTDLADITADWDRLESMPLADVRTDAEAVCLNLARTWDKRRTILYLLNYADAPAREVAVTLNLPKAPRSVRLHAPGSKAVELKPTAGADGLRVSIPQLDVFAALELD